VIKAVKIFQHSLQHLVIVHFSQTVLGDQSNLKGKSGNFQVLFLIFFKFVSFLIKFVNENAKLGNVSLNKAQKHVLLENINHGRDFVEQVVFVMSLQ
jgi:hypothetical protein